MTSCHHLVLLLVCVGHINGRMPGTNTPGTNTNQTQAQAALDEYDTRRFAFFNMVNNDKWMNVINITTEEVKFKTIDLISLWLPYSQAIKQLKIFNITHFPDRMERQFELLLKIHSTGTFQNESQLFRFLELRKHLRTLRDAARVCVKPNECLSFEPGLSNIYRHSRNYTELLDIWTSYRDETGKKMKDYFREYMELQIIEYDNSDFSDTGAYAKSTLGVNGKEDELMAMHEEIQPLYQHLHAYVRKELMKMYGDEQFPKTLHIPAHLLGEVMAMRWDRLVDDLIPFKEKTSMDVTDEMKKQNYTYLTMYQTADRFIESLGLTRMPEEFWNKSFLHDPNDDRIRKCHGSAWDFLNGNDFRINMCTKVNMEFLDKVYYQMGRIEYFIQRKEQPSAFREDAHESIGYAIGPTLSLSAMSPQYLHQIGLMPDIQDDTNSNLNYLMKIALHIIPMMPFTYLTDQWRWSVKRGDINPDQYNQHWWQLRCKHQGISPPIDRSSSDLDPAALQHFPDAKNYLQYFIANLLIFQFHEAVCEKAGHTGPLHKCNIYNSTEAGKALGDMMKLGKSVDWTVAVETLTGQTTLSAQPMLKFFAPLLDYLHETNGNETIEWNEDCPNSITID